MYFYYRPKTKEIVMRSEGRLETDLPYFEYTPTSDERDKIDKNYWLNYKDGTLRFETPQAVTQENKRKSLETLKDQITSAKDIQAVKTILISLLDNL
jgi:hypothetical protein